MLPECDVATGFVTQKCEGMCGSLESGLYAQMPTANDMQHKAAPRHSLAATRAAVPLEKISGLSHFVPAQVALNAALVCLSTSIKVF